MNNSNEFNCKTPFENLRSFKCHKLVLCQAIVAQGAGADEGWWKEDAMVQGLALTED